MFEKKLNYKRKLDSKIETNELTFLLSSICEIIKLLKGDKSSTIEELILLISLLNIKKLYVFFKDWYNEETKKVLILFKNIWLS